MAELIASGTTEASSADFTLAAGEQATLFLKDAAGPVTTPHAVAHVLIKSSDNEYFLIGKLTDSEPAKVLAAPGTYRVTRMAAAAAFGVDKV